MSISFDVDGGGLYIIRLGEAYFYGGRAENFSSRWTGHLKALRAGRHGNTFMQAVFNKYGVFNPEILERIEDITQLASAEQRWLDENFKAPGCVNVSPHSTGGNIVEWTPEKRAEHSQKLMGHVRSPESIERQVASWQENPENLPKAQASLAENSKLITPEARARAGQKTAERLTGVAQSPETKQKIGRAHKGRKNTPETRAQMSESAKRRSIEKPTSHGEETRALISSQQAGRMWINNGVENQRLFPSEAEALIATGLWKRGKKPTNAFKGLVWVTKDGEFRRVKGDRLVALLADGWVEKPPEGMTGSWVQNPTTGERRRVPASEVWDFVEAGWAEGAGATGPMAWVNYAGETKRVRLDEVDAYLSRGWSRGQPGSSAHQKGRVWVNDGTKNRKVLPEELEGVLADGWVKGVVKHQGA